MSVVVDTSVIIAVLTNEKSKSKLIKVTDGAELIAPKSMHWEIGNAFSAMLKRNRISLDLAKRAIEYYSLIPLKLQEISLVKAIEIANLYSIYAYDAYFLECARNNNARLITLDEKLINTAKKMNLSVIEV